MNKKVRTKIPLWVNIMQALLILIMIGQVYMYFFNHEMLSETGVIAEGSPMLNLVYEMGARTLVMVVASIYVMFTQNPIQYLVVLLMNVAREGLETIIDPLYPILNAPATPLVDFWIHVVIVVIEVLALFTVYKIVKNNDERIKIKAYS